MNITLATLPQATEQQVFEHIVNHLRKQGVKSKNINGTCLYRGPNSTSCAAGCCIADDEYDKRMEEQTWVDLAGSAVPRDHMGLIREMQQVHDEYDTEDWEEQFRSTANSHSLIYTKDKA